MDLIDLMREKRFLGQEFLTWVWFQAESQSGLMDLPGVGTVEVWFEDRLDLESGSGNTVQKVTCQGRELDLAEARTALREGKKVSQARIRLRLDGTEWRLTLKAEGLDISGVRAPKTLEPEEEEPESLAGRLLERVSVTRELTKVVDGMYAAFLAVRLKPEWEESELPRLRKWLQKDA